MRRIWILGQVPQGLGCVTVKLLHVVIFVKNSGGHAMFLQRIKLLSCLQELRVGVPIRLASHSLGLAFKLVHGLDSLKNLGHSLIEVFVDVRLVAKDDLVWMATHWPKIERANVAILRALR